MRSLATKSLVLLGSFLITAALLLVTYASDALKKTPLDINSITRLTGNAEVAGGDGISSTMVRATSVTHADSELSTNDVVLFENSSCLLRDPDGDAPDCVSADDPDNRLLSASTSTFATDRRSAESVPDFAGLPADATPTQGLVNKFPFGTAEQDYPFWDGTIGYPVDAKYQGQEEIDGLLTYRFLVTVDDQPAEVASGVAGTYSTEKTMWIEPVTGAIIDQRERQVRRLADGSTLLDLDFGFTPETVSGNVESSGSSASKLQVATFTGPIVGGIGGAIALVMGLYLAATEVRLAQNRRRGDGDTAKA